MNDKILSSDFDFRLKRYGYFLLLLGSLSLSVCLEAARFIDHALDWQSAALSRGLIGILFTLPLALPYKSKFNFNNKKLTLFNLLTCIYVFALFYGVSSVEPSDVIAIGNTQIIWIAIISMLFLGMRYSFKFWIATFIVLTGVSILVAAKPTDAYYTVMVLIFATLLRSVAIMILPSISELPSAFLPLHFSIMLTILGLLVFLLSGGHHHLETLLTLKNLILLFVVGATGSIFQALLAKVAWILGSIVAALMGLLSAAISYFIDIFLWNAPIDNLHIGGLFLVIIPTIVIVICGFANQKQLTNGKNNKHEYP